VILIHTNKGYAKGTVKLSTNALQQKGTSGKSIKLIPSQYSSSRYKTTHWLVVVGNTAWEGNNTQVLAKHIHNEVSMKLPKVT
jgi:hypothetical protein